MINDKLLKLNHDTNNFFGTIIVIIAFVINPFLSLLISIYFSFTQKSDYFNFILIINVSLFLGLLNSTKLLDSDLINYHLFFTKVPQYSFSDFLQNENKDYLFFAYTYIFYFLSGGSWEIYLTISTAISYYLILKSNFIIAKTYNSSNYLITYLIIIIGFLYPLFIHSAHLFRNFLAASFVFYFLINYYVLNKRKFWLILVAFLTHASSWVFAIILILPNKHLNEKFKTRFIVLLFSLILFNYFNLDFIFQSNQALRIAEEVASESVFNIDRYSYFVVILFLMLFTYEKTKTIKHKYNINLYSLVVLFIIVIAVLFLYVGGSVIYHRYLLYSVMLSTIYLSIFIIAKKRKIAPIIAALLTILNLVAFSQNYQYGAWKYADFTSIISNFLFSYF